jgi:hypothetical protein
MSEMDEREKSAKETTEQLEGQERPDEAVERIEGKVETPDLDEEADEDIVQIGQEGAEIVEAKTVLVESGAIGKAAAESIEIKEGAIGLAQGGTITVHEGAIGAAFVERAEVHNGAVLLMLAEEIGGETKVLFDLRAAVVFGLIVGVVSGLFKLFAGRKGN